MPELETKIKHKFDEKVESAVGAIVVDSEYETAKSSQQADNADFERIIDMLEAKRSEKDYEWMSDFFFPEMTSIILAEGSDWSGQYFQTRDFVTVKLEGDVPENKGKCTAAQKCINKTLNRRGLNHYAKYIRGRTINALASHVYAICWWDQEIVTETKYREELQETDTDIYGNPMTNLEFQTPYKKQVSIPYSVEHLKADNFNYDIIDPRNVFTDNKYCYSPQERNYIIIRSEKTYEELKANEVTNGYFNLDLVKELSSKQAYGKGETDTAKETYNRPEAKDQPIKTPIKPFDVLERYGWFYCKVNERTLDGYPSKIEPGYNWDGIVIDDAELILTRLAYLVYGSTKILIRFQPEPCRDSRGKPYMPILRGLCYIHPTKDTGLGDGKYCRELQIGINDTLNLSMDRTKLSTLPTLQGAKYALQDNTTIYFAPQHVMEVENPGKDLVEFRLDPNTQDALGQIALLRGAMNQVTARYPTTMGDLPRQASTTATASAGAEMRTSARTNYKSLTYEFTLLLDEYWMILQMTNQFAKPETMIKLMGSDVYSFDPDADYTYTPVTGAIEQEYSKFRKLQVIDQMLGRVVNIPNPNTPKLLNYLLKKAFELFGDEFPDYKDFLLDDSKQASDAMMQQNQPANAQMSNLGGVPTSNQAGIPQSPAEQTVREGMV